MFSVYLFAADPEKLRKKWSDDECLLDGIVARVKRAGHVPPEDLPDLCARVSTVRTLNWPMPGDDLSVNAFLWMLDYAAEPINIARLRDVRYSSLVDEVPLLAEMTAEPGPLPVPSIRGSEYEIGYLPPGKLRELADRGAPSAANRDLDVGEELIEVFESLADDDVGLYTVIDGAKISRERS